MMSGIDSLPTMATFPDLLKHRLARDPGRPFVTYYDEATGERTELSVKTYANWVSKTANLLVDELLLDPDDVLLVDLPPHWLSPVFVGAAWCAGLRPVSSPEGEQPSAVVVGPGVADQGVPTLACSLDPFAGRLPADVPPRVHDYGILWPGQSDVFSAYDAVVLPEAAASDERVLTDADPAGPGGRLLLLSLLAGSGSLVLLRNAADDQWPARAESERATAIRRAGR